MDESIIKIESLNFYWSKKSNFKIFVPSLEIKKGEKVLLLGESGSGKTTLLSLICGFLNPLSGSISINGNTINKLSSKTKDEYRADNIGIIFQQFNLLPYANVVDNVLLPLYFSQARSKNIVNKENQTSVSKILQSEKIKISCRGFEAVLDDTKKGDLIYFDPPYQPISSTANFTSYTHRDFTEDDLERLATLANQLNSKGCHVLLSNSNSKVVKDYFSEKHWKISSINANRAINSNAQKRTGHKEIIIKNY